MSDLAVVTGASRGIGRACALALARRGLDVALLGRPSGRLDGACRDCAALGVEARSYHCDLSEADTVTAATTRLLAEMGTPRVVVNNAGELGPRAALHELAVTDWDRVIAVNLRGPFLLCRALLPAMRTAGRGRLLQLGSISSTIGCAERSAYAASKWGLLGLSRSLAEELRGSGLQSIAILPGSVDTSMLARTSFEPNMSPAEVAALVVFYALDAPDAVQGAAVEAYGP